MKTVSLAPINRRPQIRTNERVLDALLAEQVDVIMACRGRGLCATCHVHVEKGDDSLTPMTPRERRTLGRISGISPNSRLACQARVMREGVVVRLPDGMYVTKTKDIEDLIGRRAEANILHPIDGRILIETGKIITRSYIMKLKDLDVEVERIATTDVI